MVKFHSLWSGKPIRVEATPEETLITFKDARHEFTLPVDSILTGETFEMLDQAMANGDFLPLGIEFEEDE